MENRSAVERVGYAVGIGLVFVATLGVYWRFAYPTSGVAVWGLGSLLIGAAVGAAVGWLTSRLRRPKR